MTDNSDSHIVLWLGEPKTNKTGQKQIKMVWKLSLWSRLRLLIFGKIEFLASRDQSGLTVVGRLK